MRILKCVKVVLFVLGILSFQENWAQNYSEYTPVSAFSAGTVNDPDMVRFKELPDGKIMGVSRNFKVDLFSPTGMGLSTKTYSAASDWGDPVMFIEEDGVLLVGGVNGVENPYVHGFHYPDPPELSYDIWMVKVDFNGDTLWTKCIGSHEKDRFSKIIRANDGGYLMFANVGAEDGDVSIDLTGTGNLYWFCKLDNTGNIQWEYAPVEESFGDERQCIAQAAEGNIYLYMTGTFTVPFILILDEDGNLIERVDETGYQTKLDETREGLITSGGNFIVSGMGRKETSYTYPILQKFDADGKFVKELWMDEIGVNGNLIKMIAHENGELYLLLKAQDTPGFLPDYHDLVWVKTDTSLNALEFSDRIYGDIDDLPVDFSFTSDGGMLILAESNSEDLHYWDGLYAPLRHFIQLDPCTVKAGFSYAANEDLKTINFTNTSEGEVLIEYDMAGLGQTTNPNPTYTFPTQGIYEVCLTALAADYCESTYCDSVNTTGMDISIEEQMQERIVVVVYGDKLIISGTNQERVELLDLSGKVVRFGTDDQTIDLVGLSQGTYFCRVSDPVSQVSITKKVLLNKHF